MRILKFFFFLAILVVVLGAIGFWYLFVRTEPLLDATLDAPKQVAVGEEVRWVIRCSNPHDEPVTLDSIDVDAELLEGIQVLDIEPLPERRGDIPFTEDESWTFSRTAEPGETIVVTIRVRGRKEGIYVGSIDATNPNVDWVGLRHAYTVTRPGAPPTD